MAYPDKEFRNGPARFLGAMTVLTIMVPSMIFAQESGEKKYGVIHNIAEDRRIERVGGVYEPEGIDKYMKRRFDALQEQMRLLNDKVDGIQVSLLQLREELEKDEEIVLVS